MIVFTWKKVQKLLLWLFAFSVVVGISMPPTSATSRELPQASNSKPAIVAIVSDAAKTKSFWLLNNYLTIVADRTTTDGKYDLVEGYFPPGAQTPPHRHTRYSEQLYVLEGEFTVWVGKNKLVLGPGESAFIPMGTPHVVAALSDQPARGLVVASPSGFAQLVEATGTQNQNEAPDMELFNRISTELGDEILGAPGDLP
ncbi:cupin domain-containing protein [Nostoc sp.]|uniref:cupin domain-containing protein n=1 Tax=Nostoc sp. TaxID=1180 RepID=UPI002FF4EA42